jgi:hypothetical protein
MSDRCSLFWKKKYDRSPEDSFAHMRSQEICPSVCSATFGAPVIQPVLIDSYQIRRFGVRS